MATASKRCSSHATWPTPPPVVQDWGDPIGLAWATRHPERVRSLFILNAFAHRPRTETLLPLVVRLFRAPGVGEAMIQVGHLFVRGYCSRRVSSTRNDSAWRRASSSTSGDKPVAFVWPMQDSAFTPGYLDRRLETFPHTEVTRIEEASHYVQEEAHAVVIPRLLEFLRR